MLTYDARFIAGFFPLLLIIFWWWGRRSPAAAVAILLGASVLFYAVAEPVYAPLIFSLVLVNFALGFALTRSAGIGGGRWTMLGIVLNVAILAFYKYWGADTPSSGAAPAAGLIQAGLPLGLSFFILKQISWLADLRSAAAPAIGARDLPRFALYSIFFPQMIAGPVYRYRDAAEDYAGLGREPLPLATLATGLSVFAVGLAKKVLLADPIGGVASPVFDAVAAGHAPGIAEAWIGGWAYMLQLYFDFSGISDMALGIGLCFGLKLPINFYSPLKARSASQFFDRWHISLVIFVRTYLFSPILQRVRRWVSGTGATRTMKATAVATLVSLALVGWWHGAKPTFVLSGLLVGLVSVVLQLYAFRRYARGGPRGLARRGGAYASRVLLVLGILAFGILFRSADLAVAGTMLLGLAGLSGDPGSAALLPDLASIAHPDSLLHLEAPVPAVGLLMTALGTAIAFLAPSSVQIFALHDHPGAPRRPGQPPASGYKLAPALRWAFAGGLFLSLSLMQVVNGGQKSTIYARF
jgi:D-alanyl-lipoteichoic acid acyltransferase DltB (MBOAT superfamily)